MNCDMCDTLKEDLSAYKVEGHTFNWCDECVEANGYLGERVFICGDHLVPIGECGCKL